MATLRTLDEELVLRTQVNSAGAAGGLVPILLAGVLCTLPLTELQANIGGALIEDSITDGVTTKAPSQNAVYDALALKLDALTAAITYQPLDSALTAIAALTTTSYGRGFLTLADTAAAFTKMGLGTAAAVNTGTSGATIPLLNGGNLWGAARNQFAANSEQFAIGVRWGLSTGSFWFGASNSATPDAIFSNTSGTEVMRLLNSGGMQISANNQALLITGATNPYWQVTSTTNTVQLFGQALSTGARFGTLSNHNLDILINSASVAQFSAAGLVVGGGTNISPGSGGQAQFASSGYMGFLAMNGTAMYLGHNSGSRDFSVHLAGANRLYVSAGGVITFSNYGAGTLQTNSSGVISASSDRDLKDIEGLFTRGIADLRKFLPKLYRWKPDTPYADPMLYAGFVAQEVHLGLPEAIGIGGDGFLTLQDRPILAAHHNAILELDDRVRQLELAA